MSFKVVDQPTCDNSLRRKIERIKRKKLASEKVVSLEDFRKLRKPMELLSILVVDDDEIMRNAMKRILEGEGYRIILAEDGMELSKVLERVRLDLILLDVNLPWVDGFELCQMIKGHHSLRNVPLILVSGRKSKEDVRLGFESGCDDYITKPFDIDLMTGAIVKALQKSS